VTRVVRPLIAALALVSMAEAAIAQGRPALGRLTCAQAQNLVAQRGEVVFDTGPHTFLGFVRDQTFCPRGDTTEATAFAWDIYAFGSGADLDAANINLSGLDATNDFSSPDGLWFGRPSNASGLVKPLMWIETDDGAYTDVTNCMLLCSQPGVVGDGATKTITNTLGGASATQSTRVGALPGGNLRRFLVGPKEAEITGIDTTPDGRTVFVNIQHPGENGSPASPTSNWPNSQGGTASGRPRSATIAITKDDGGVVGL
jgi:secreted PhoX family phosphatase